MSLTHPCGVDRYRRTAEFDRKTSGLRLRAVEWQVLLAVDGLKPLDAVAAECSLPREDVVAILARFESLGMVETQKLTLEEFRSLGRETTPAAPRVTFSLKRASASENGG
jgi:hypothetical protein